MNSPELPPLVIGDYVLATRWHDGDPGDPWALGYYEGRENGRHIVKDSAGRVIRPGGFLRAGRVREDVGAWLLKNAKALESSPPGTVNLWTMLTASARCEEEDPPAEAGGQVQTVE